MTKFDPSRYVRKLPRGGEYLEVKYRLLWLRTEHPEAVVETKVVEHEPGKYALFRAQVRVPGGGEASGYGMETADNFGDYLEKAETKALGRALAALGYGTQFALEFAEEEPVDAAVQPAPAETTAQAETPQGARPKPEATLEARAEEARKWIVKHCTRADVPVGVVMERLREAGLGNLATLTPTDFKYILQVIKEEAAKQQPQPVPGGRSG